MATLKQVDNGLEYAYKEPSTNKDGSPLKDLDRVEVFVDIGTGPVLAISVPASAPTGGGDQVVIISNPIVEDQEAVVNVHSVAIDDNNRRSEIGGQASVEVDNLPPAPTV